MVVVVDLLPFPNTLAELVEAVGHHGRDAYEVPYRPETSHGKVALQRVGCQCTIFQIWKEREVKQELRRWSHGLCIVRGRSHRSAACPGRCGGVVWAAC